MRNLKNKLCYFILSLCILIIVSCSIDKEKFLLEEVGLYANDTLVTKNEWAFKSHSSYFSSSNLNKFEDVTIRFNNEKLSTILDKFEYSYSIKTLKKNPTLKIDYYKKNITKKEAIKEVISRLKKMYNF